MSDKKNSPSEEPWAGFLPNYPDSFGANRKKPTDRVPHNAKLAALNDALQPIIEFTDKLERYQKQVKGIEWAEFHVIRLRGPEDEESTALDSKDLYRLRDAYRAFAR